MQSSPLASTPFNVIRQQTSVEIENWDRVLKGQLPDVAENLSKKIYNQVLEHLKQNLSKGIYQQYSKGHSFVGHFDFNIRNIEAFKVVFEGCLPPDCPVNEWIAAIESRKPPEKAVVNVEVKDSSLGAKVAVDVRSKPTQPINYSGFNERLAVLGGAVRDKLNSLLTDFTTTKEPGVFGFEVTFTRQIQDRGSYKISSSVYSSSYSEENDLKVKAWFLYNERKFTAVTIDPSLVNPDEEQAGSNPNTGSGRNCIVM